MCPFSNCLSTSNRFRAIENWHISSHFRTQVDLRIGFKSTLGASSYVLVTFASHYAMSYCTEAGNTAHFRAKMSPQHFESFFRKIDTTTIRCFYENFNVLRDFSQYPIAQIYVVFLAKATVNRKISFRTRLEGTDTNERTVVAQLSRRIPRRCQSWHC